MKLRASLIVRDKRGGLVQLIELFSLDDSHVSEVVAELSKTFGDQFVIDQSQVEAARRAAMLAA
jgi:hypothetical protein